MAQLPLQATVIEQEEPFTNQALIQMALFNPDGSPYAADQTGMVPAAAQADFAGADITALKVELNAFLAKLEAAGIVLT